METEMLEILETVTIAVSGFLIKRYVFLEPDMESGKQRIFYCVSFFLIGIVFFVFGKDTASLAALFMIGLNICLGRKKHRLWGIVLMIPFLGIINGLLLPVLLVPPYLLAMSVQETRVYQFMFYGVLLVLLILFYVKGRNWRSWFHENMQHRSLRKSEEYLLWVVGILMLFFSKNIAIQIASDSGNVRDSMYGQGLASFIGISSISAFVMTITIIVLIMQGNKRSFYHERVSSMQSGMITFLAEVVENRDDNTGGHIRRTAKYVDSIAKELKRRGIYSNILTDRYMSDMVVAAPLHDIGKIHIPDAVLNKPGKLTEEEFEVMKTHTTAVADVFDALTSKRCYKNAMPLEKAYAIIREESGTHFDPAVVEAFFAGVENVGTKTV